MEADFQKVLDEYLKDCEERAAQPEQPYKGTFNVRISSDLHRAIAIYAIEHDKSLNAAVEEAIQRMVELRERNIQCP
nr:type II toxin-antitoxin system HicB family antitoxin [Muricomes sp. OA1]